jgi:hypothetical protein
MQQRFSFVVLTVLLVALFVPRPGSATDSHALCSCNVDESRRHLHEKAHEELWALVDASGDVEIEQSDRNLAPKAPKGSKSGSECPTQPIVPCVCECTLQNVPNVCLCCGAAGNSCPKSTKSKKGSNKSSKKNGGDRKLQEEASDITHPWASPSSTHDATLVVENPGIWILEDFLTEQEVQDITVAIKRVEAQPDIFDACGPSHGKQSQCAYLGAKDAITDADKAAFTSLLSKIQAVWGHHGQLDLSKQRDLFFVQRMALGNPPTKMHMDFKEDASIAPVSVVLYLDDSKAGTVFETTTLKPKKGRMATWLNVNSDGSPNLRSSHGVQGLPENGTERLTMSYSFFFDHEVPTLLTE